MKISLNSPLKLPSPRLSHLKQTESGVSGGLKVVSDHYFLKWEQQWGMKNIFECFWNTKTLVSIKSTHISPPQRDGPFSERFESDVERKDGWQWSGWCRGSITTFVWWLCCCGRIRLRRSKPRRIWWIEGYWEMATDVRDRVEATEGLYLGCGPGYSGRKMRCWWISWSIDEKMKSDGWIKGENERSVLFTS